MKITTQEHAQALEMLNKLVKAGDTIYTVLRHVSRSGMSRNIDMYVIKDNQPVFITGYAGKLLGLKHDYKGHGGLVVGGCGMDMGFHLVYELGGRMFKSGAGTDGGYSFKHQWI